MFYCIIQLFILPVVCSYNYKWWVYSSDGVAYLAAPVIKSYIIGNSKNLKGLLHRVYSKDSNIDPTEHWLIVFSY